MLNLSQLRPGQVAHVIDLTVCNRTTSRLREMGLVEGVRIERLRTAPLGDPVEYYACGYRLALRRAEASHVQVTLVDP